MVCGPVGEFKKALWEQNQLTRRLLAAGYTRDDGPDFVRPYEEYEGGFTYTGEYLNESVFQTHCGLLLKGSHFQNGYMSYMGIDWRAENDNPVIYCPYQKERCALNHPLLRNLKLVQCECIPAAVPYEYQTSYDKVVDDLQKEKRLLFERFTEQKKGRTCIYHCDYSEKTKQWNQSYDPMTCTRTVGCTFCTILQKELTPKKGNVFYDRKVTRICQDGSLFHGMETVTIIKGCKLLKHSVSLDICQQLFKCMKKAISKSQGTVFVGEEGTKLEIQNIRIERRETRDLLQDLQDVQEGIAVYHASDSEALAKEQKRRRRQAARERRIKTMRKKIREKGLDQLNADDQVRAGKLLTPEIIHAENEWFLQSKEKASEVTQMTIFDTL